jgi:polyferredoxin
VILYLDPWRWATLQESKGSLISRIANCTNCAHCIDLNTPDSSDDNRLKIIRNEQYLMISEWVDSYWRNVKQIPMLQTE